MVPFLRPNDPFRKLLENMRYWLEEMINVKPDTLDLHFVNHAHILRISERYTHARSAVWKCNEIYGVLSLNSAL